ncbi:MAG: hypothetical protein CVU16_06890 [Betaproteobacteria bacterium HGW-Betaproteobacteria-10]|nr:MAG: hypothetical protein CVU16_06890 [Betaproteobacteria bacterium HGW-Betaproteobacteria-10]
MKKRLLGVWGIFLMQAVAAHGGAAGQIDDSMPEAQKIRFCERVRDHALQTFYNRDKGRPMKLYAEDGSDGARITNFIIRRIYEEPQISSPKKAETFGRATCNEMMGSKLAPE